jgi:hypothetical protein
VSAVFSLADLRSNVHDVLEDVDQLLESLEESDVPIYSEYLLPLINAQGALKEAVHQVCLIERGSVDPSHRLELIREQMRT